MTDPMDMSDLSADNAGKPALGLLLIQQNVISADQLDVALGMQQRTRKPLGQILVEANFASEEVVARAMAQQTGLPYIDLRKIEIHPDIVRSLTERQAQRLGAVVLEDRGSTYLVALTDPTDIRAQDELSVILNRPLDFMVTTVSQFNKTLDRVYRRPDQLGEFAREVEREIGSDDTVIDLMQAGRSPSDTDAPVIKLLQTVFDDAARLHASDIHIEPQEATLIIRFRIDGELHIQIQTDPRIAPLLIVRLKLMANLNIAERRLPQDGRISVRASNSQFDVRMSTLPTQFGESVVLRLLRQDKARLRLNQLMNPRICQLFESTIRKPHGIVLVVGPTGSGKTTTLYAALEQLNDPEVKILTAEDPVEYRLAGVNQVQINDRIGLDFARVLRSFLRQDPDIILVGEIRDKETAEIAVRAALTGHLVLSTLHTNDAPSTPLRLMDMGIPAYMIASTLLTVLSLRLVRVNCTDCAEPEEPGPESLATLRRFLDEETIRKGKYMRGKGCPHCNHIGYAGRRGVYEIMMMTPELSQTMQLGAPGDFEQAAYQRLGRNTLAYSALDLVLSGQTTLSEAMTVIADARTDLIGTL
ncbi:MAG: GspE/PulE family protein [Limnohabitans sp.]